MNKIIISMLLFSILLFGCLAEPEAPEVSEEEEELPAEVVPTPTFTIASPTQGELVVSTEDFAEVVVSISAQNLIVKSPGGTAKMGDGHFNFVLDGGDVIVVSGKTYTLNGLGAGSHTLRVELMNNDNTPYSPAIVREVTFSVETAPAEYVPQEHTVAIKDFSFEPEQLTVNVDDTVTWKNEGAYPRSATCFLNGEEVFDTDVIAPGKSATLTMGKALTCEYYSLTHMAMKGHITVEPHD